MRAKLYWSTGLWFAASVWLSQHFCEWTFVQLKPVFRMRLVCGSWLRNGLGNFLGMGCLRMVCLRCQLSCWLVPDTNWLEYDLSRSPPLPPPPPPPPKKKKKKKQHLGRLNVYLPSIAWSLCTTLLCTVLLQISEELTFSAATAWRQQLRTSNDE